MLILFSNLKFGVDFKMTPEFTSVFADVFFYFYLKIYIEHSIRVRRLHILTKEMNFKNYKRNKLVS